MIRVKLQPGQEGSFATWQASLHQQITPFPGFISLEILAPAPQDEGIWHIIPRFESAALAEQWQNSSIYAELFKTLQTFAVVEKPEEGDKKAQGLAQGLVQEKMTEVFVTHVDPKKDRDFRRWIGKIHQAEAKFPGFKGVYVQAPSCRSNTHTWITLLQFDTPEHLENWLNSSERHHILQEGKPFINTLETHQVLTSYAGWFSSLTNNTNTVPPVWKQTLLVLLVLFPIVMLELQYLSPYLAPHLSKAPATFIGNALSVSLIAWPLMPLMIRLLSWWLLTSSPRKTLLGTLLILGLYALEILFFIS